MQTNEAEPRPDTNPDKLTYEEILDLIKFCPICGNTWSREKHTCANKDCLVKVRVEPRALNWWLFYPRHNRWEHYKE